MRCERYNCTMSELSCFVRRKNALSELPRDKYKPGFTDKGCLNCQQGIEVAKKQNPKEVEAYSAELKEIRKRAATDPINNKRPGKKVSLATKEIQPATVSSTPAKTKNEFIMLDINEHDELFDYIKKEAYEQFRSVENQILYILHIHRKGIMPGKDFIR